MHILYVTEVATYSVADCSIRVVDCSIRVSQSFLASIVEQKWGMALRLHRLWHVA